MPDNWRSVELKHLRALRAVADTGTFWAAAVELNSSLSTVSDHVTALEALVGQRLIERSRGRRTVELTEAGRVLLGHAEAIEARLRAAEADFAADRAFSGPAHGRADRGGARFARPRGGNRVPLASGRGRLPRVLVGPVGQLAHRHLSERCQQGAARGHAPFQTAVAGRGCPTYRGCT